MRKNFTREKTYYCGENYREIDIFPYTQTQQEASRRKGSRSKKEKVTEPKQKNLNDKNAKRYFIQLINANFGEKDFHITLSYDDKFLPATLEDAEKEAQNYIDRVKYRRKKEGLQPLKYILVTENKTKKGKDRWHHHIIMNGGLDRDVVEELWSRKKKGQKKGESLGTVNSRRLQVGDDGKGMSGLGRYLSKDPKGKKRWNSSKNLDRPWSRTNDHEYSRREVERIVKNPPGREYWEKRYPGWTLEDTDYGCIAVENEITGWSLYLKLRRRI